MAPESGFDFEAGMRGEFCTRIPMSKFRFSVKFQLGSGFNFVAGFRRRGAKTNQKNQDFEILPGCENLGSGLAPFSLACVRKSIRDRNKKVGLSSPTGLGLNANENRRPPERLRNKLQYISLFEPSSHRQRNAIRAGDVDERN